MRLETPRLACPGGRHPSPPVSRRGARLRSTPGVGPARLGCAQWAGEDFADDSLWKWHLRRGPCERKQHCLADWALCCDQGFADDCRVRQQLLSQGSVQAGPAAQRCQSTNLSGAFPSSGKEPSILKFPRAGRYPANRFPGQSPCCAIGPAATERGVAGHHNRLRRDARGALERDPANGCGAKSPNAPRVRRASAR